MPLTENNSTSITLSGASCSEALEKTYSEADLIRNWEAQSTLSLTAKYKNLIEGYRGERRENTQGSENDPNSLLIYQDYNTEILLSRTNLTPLATDFDKSKFLIEKKIKKHLCGFRLERALCSFLQGFRTLGVPSSDPSLLVSYVLTKLMFKDNILDQS